MKRNLSGTKHIKRQKVTVHTNDNRRSDRETVKDQSNVSTNELLIKLYRSIIEYRSYKWILFVAAVEW